MRLHAHDLESEAWRFTDTEQKLLLRNRGERDISRGNGGGAARRMALLSPASF
jgi:hypothetical protein